MIPRTLVVTNDFPPRVGGVQQYVWNLVRLLPPDRVAVLAPNWPGARAHDRDLGFPVHRWPARSLWPTGDLAARVRMLLAEHGAETVLFGHGFPLPLLAPGLADRGVRSVVLTHGAEVWLARVPGVARAMGRAFGAAAAVTAVSRATASAFARVVAPHVSFTVLPPGVDERRFRPGLDGGPMREWLGVGDRPVLLCVSRLVRRKGQDVLIRAMGTITRLVPEAVLALAGDGPYRRRLESLAGEAPPGSVVLAGAVSDADLPALYAACDVFAMPCRSRWGGLEVEGFGIVFLEAAAAGKATVAGRSGGSEEAVVDEETGVLVEGGEPKAVALPAARLLAHPSLAAAMGRAARARVEAEFTWARQATRLAAILREAAGGRAS